VSVTSAVLHGNAAGDLLNVPCGSVSWSDVGTVTCTGVNGNLQVDPQLLADYRLGPSSPCLDHGPSPATYTGTPSVDLAGGVRLRDWDGDGLAVIDIGAYEMANPALAPGEVTNLRAASKTALTWSSVATAVEYHVYPELPAAGQGFGYLITAENGAGSEGTLGFASAAERSNFSPCP
jgi:hypothetical protein